MSSIFLSYNHADKPFARRLAQDLEASGVRVWLDELEMMIGDSLIEKISKAIDEMEYLGVILSPNSVKSRWVKEEVERAMNQQIDNKRIKVLPLLIEACELPWFLQGKLYADFTSPEQYEEELTKVLRRIQQEVPVANFFVETSISIEVLDDGFYIHSHKGETYKMPRVFPPISRSQSNNILKQIQYLNKINTFINVFATRYREFQALLTRCKHALEYAHSQRDSAGFQRLLYEAAYCLDEIMVSAKDLREVLGKLPRSVSRIGFIVVFLHIPFLLSAIKINMICDTKSINFQNALLLAEALQGHIERSVHILSLMFEKYFISREY